MQLEYAIYMSVNKDTDEIHIEFLKLDWAIGEEFFHKAEGIVWERFPPKKISDSAAFYKCKMCEMSPICHLKEAPEVNCRSCKHSVAKPGKIWYCEFHNVNLETDTIKRGCADYQRIV